MSRAKQKLNRATRKGLVERLNRDAARLAAHFGLRYREVEAERVGVKSRYGACFEDGTIKIRLVHALTGVPLQYSSLVDTLCHELAHLKYWHHGPGFLAFYKRILTQARHDRIYQPRPRSARPVVAPSEASAPPALVPAVAAAPEQLSLFEPAP